MELSLLLQATDALKALKLDSDIKQLDNGLKVVNPSKEIAKLRASELKAKLIRAMRLIIMLEALLGNNQRL
jgi:hypothetical protein